MTPEQLNNESEKSTKKLFKNLSIEKRSKNLIDIIHILIPQPLKIMDVDLNNFKEFMN